MGARGRLLIEGPGGTLATADVDGELVSVLAHLQSLSDGLFPLR